MGKKNISSDFLVARPSAVSGIARFFDFGATFDEYNSSRTTDEADANSMYADWAVVGDSIRSAACRFKAKAKGDAEEEAA